VRSCYLEREAAEGFIAAYREPLVARLNDFIEEAQLKVRVAEDLIETLTKQVAEIRIEFGEESVMANPNDDECSGFFTLFCDVVKKYGDAYKQTVDWKDSVRHYKFKLYWLYAYFLHW